MYYIGSDGKRVYTLQVPYLFALCPVYLFNRFVIYRKWTCKEHQHNPRIPHVSHLTINFQRSALFARSDSDFYRLNHPIRYFNTIRSKCIANSKTLSNALSPSSHSNKERSNCAVFRRIAAERQMKL